MKKINKIPSATKGIISITPDKPLKEAITLMLTNDYSQIPVINGKKVLGIVGWKSIGIYKNLGNNILLVKDCLNKDFKIYNSNTFVEKVIEDVLKYEFILVENIEKNITGLVTLFDISREYHLLSEPFILLENFEKQIRIFLKNYLPLEYSYKTSKYTLNKQEGYKIDNELTLGEYLLIFENDSNWKKFEADNINLDKKIIIKELEVIRRFRNDLMHFKKPNNYKSNLLKIKRMGNIFTIINSKN